MVWFFFFFLYSLKRHKQGGFYSFLENIILPLYLLKLFQLFLIWLFSTDIELIFFTASSTSESPASCLFSFAKFLQVLFVPHSFHPHLWSKKSLHLKKNTRHNKVSDFFLTHNIFMCFSPSLEALKADWMHAREKK